MNRDAAEAPGLAWAGDFPDEWEPRRLGTLFRQRDVRNCPDLPIMNVSIRSGVSIREFSDDRVEQQSSDRSSYKVARKGDIAFNKMRMWQGAVGVSPLDGLVSPDYVVAIPGQEVLSEFFGRLFRTPVFSGEVLRHSHGIVDDRNRLYWDGFKSIKVPVPTLPTQRAIAAFLDRETDRLDTLVAKKERLLELLDEKRSALISHAVTKGLDPEVPMKESGVEWIGEVPEGWEVVRLKESSSVMMSNVDKKSHDGETEIRLCNYTDVYYRERITDDLDLMRASASLAQIRRLTLRQGDVLITKDSESPDDIAVPAVAADDLPGVVCGYHLALVRPSADRLSGFYLFRALQAAGAQAEFGLRANGVTRYGIPVSGFSTFPIPIPPLPTQKAIADYLDRETTKIDALKAKVTEAIERLKEYRTSLISAAVTGQIEVPETEDAA